MYKTNASFNRVVVLGVCVRVFVAVDKYDSDCVVVQDSLFRKQGRDSQRFLVRAHSRPSGPIVLNLCPGRMHCPVDSLSAARIMAAMQSAALLVHALAQHPLSLH